MPRPDPLELVILVGLQGAGKTTFYRRRYAGTHAHVSKDAMPNARNKERRQAALISEALAQGRSVVVDNTNPTRASRRALIDLGRAHGAWVVACYLPVPVADAVSRNGRREGRARVPVVGILATAKKLDVPSPDEGFDELVVVPIDPLERLSQLPSGHTT